MLTIKNIYETKENVTHITLSKKDGSTLLTKIDTEDLEKVLDKGVWIAQWHKDFNNYLALTKSDFNIDGEEHSEKLALHSFLMGTHPKAPIRHRNGNTLDNRKSNLEVYNQNASINDYKILDSETIVLILRDKYGKDNGKAIIDSEDLKKVINNGYTWVLYKSHGEPCAIANTPEGRIHLNRFIMDTPEDAITSHINLNTLDNRKVNLKNTVIKEESESEEEV